MRAANLHDLNCPVARAIGALGDPWTLMIVRELMLGSHRFDEFEAQLRASPALISERLKALCASGIVSRRQYEAMPPRFEYRLTRKGLDLWPLMLGLKHWGDKWGAWEAGSPAVLVHGKCEHETGIKMVCECCGETLSPGDVRIDMRSPMQDERHALSAAKRAGNAAKAASRRRSRSRSGGEA